MARCVWGGSELPAACMQCQACHSGCPPWQVVHLPAINTLDKFPHADNTPDARESAKKVIVLLKAACADPAIEGQLAVAAPPAPAAGEGEEAIKQASKWELYCQSNLSGTVALAVLKACSD